VLNNINNMMIGDFLTYDVDHNINDINYKLAKHLKEKTKHNNIIQYIKNNVVDELMKINLSSGFIDTFKILKYNNHYKELIDLYNFINKNYKIQLLELYDVLRNYVPIECHIFPT